MPRDRSVFFTIIVAAACWLLLTDRAAAQPVDESHATTEHSCSFGMGKGEPSHSCAVPFPAGCRVAQAPGSSQPWATISKAGRLMCRFDEKRTDWKSKITGACGRCQSGHCSAQFSVRFDCSSIQ